MSTQIPTLRCLHRHLDGTPCGHVWIPRTPRPKQCPKCTSRIWFKDLEKEATT